MGNLNFRKKIVDSWFSFLQVQICKEFEQIEKNRTMFVKHSWAKQNKKNGGGISFILKDGKVFEKVGVNKSTVSGKFTKQFRSKILGANKNGNYWASGISVVAHMKNPKVPAIHFNTRFIVTSKEWFGGGIDVTPSFRDYKEEQLVHKILKDVCIKNKKNYKKYKEWCDRYFYLPHRKEIRGIGGIFFDYEMSNWNKNFKFVRDVGLSFVRLSKEIINRKKNLKWTKRDREKQLIKRGRYVEFNLLYDRGTKFGLNSGGNVEAILMSLPPKAKWE